ncbi:MAG: magnesium transporter [Pirellulales bacterium]|nr:magnesium transporter [Pirellulales bacterium]
MTNTLYLPEIREMLAENNAVELQEFCQALHPARTAEFMEGLRADESWNVLKHADNGSRVEIFAYFDPSKQVEVIETADEHDVATLLERLPNDDLVDLLDHVSPDRVATLLPLLPNAMRRDVLRLRAYPEDSAGAVMTTEFARLKETDTVRQALADVSQQAEGLETIYYLYVIDEEDHLRGTVSARQLVSAMGHPDVKIVDLMERDVVSVEAEDDQEEVLHKVARYDLMAIPVVDHEHHMLGIVTHDDVIDVAREEATEDAHRVGGIDPLEHGYLETKLPLLIWKRGVWLVIFFCGALLTTVALQEHESTLASVTWLVFFIPLVNSSGGNTGNQSATLVITALATGDITFRDGWKVIRREFLMGVALGGILAVGAFGTSMVFDEPGWLGSTVVATSLFLVVLCGTAAGTLLPLAFHRLGLDPALMSNPLVASLIDFLGIAIYLNVALLLLPKIAGG